ncbi:MAG: GNAT family N-acetyltransferase [Prolixibacteraceae bacterium]
MIIRKALADDTQQIIRFQIAMALETENATLDPGTVSCGVTAVFTDPGKGTYYVAEDNGLAIGSLLTTFEWSDWRNGTVLWIQSVYVLPEFRQKGIYKSLYGHIKTLVEHDSNLKGIRLYADKSNLTAQQVYEKLGMTADHYQLYEWLKP